MTVGLCVITPELTNELARKLSDLSQYVDEIYVQVNGKNAVVKPMYKYHISRFAWNDNFADARNALLAEVQTDYWLWMDADDTLHQPENIRRVIGHMERNELEIVFADYIYTRNEQGMPTEVERRERFFKTGTPGQWRGTPRVHETFIPNGSCATENTQLVTWIHQRHNFGESETRNERLLHLDWEDTKDPRAAYYMGLNQASQDKFEEAIPWFEKLIKTGGWDEERYRAHLQIAACYQQLGRLAEAVEEYLQATKELPDWPDAYYGLQQVYYEVDDHEKSIVWFETARTKKRPDTDSAYNPVVIEYQPLLIGALSYLFIGQVDNAVRTAGRLKQIAPHYPELAKLEPEIIRAYNEQQAVEAVKTLTKFADKYNGDPKAILEAIPPTLKADIRLTDQRRTFIPGKVWPENSIVFYCGRSYEPWGPDFLSAGMGGSEEAVVYLARELAEQGLEVDIYNERTEYHGDWLGEHIEGLTPPKVVRYSPWTEINPNDTFDTFVAWRDPTILKEVTARVKLCDLHDTIDPQIVYANQGWVDKYLFKSKWFRDLYPELPDDKCVIIPNGVKPSYV